MLEESQTPRLPTTSQRVPKEQVVSQSTPSLVRSIADALVIKDKNLFFLSRRDGSVPLNDRHGFGLYYQDCRYLSGYTLMLGETRPHALVSTASKGFMALVQLSNEEFLGLNGNFIRKEQLGMKWRRVIDAEKNALRDFITFQNFSLEPMHFEASLAFSATFEDVFAVRGLLKDGCGIDARPSWQAERLTFLYEGRDRLFRSVDIQFSPRPDVEDESVAGFHVYLAPQQSKEYLITLSVAESEIHPSKEERSFPEPVWGGAEGGVEERAKSCLTDQAKVESDSLSLNRTIDRSFRDLRTLESFHGGQGYFAAGIPWFATLFGRDSLITALQMLAYNPGIAEQTLRLLARYQGTKVDTWRDEAPGKILHELRVGELARVGEIPHTPYYGTVDATPLFLVLLARHAEWTGTLGLFNELRDSVEGALAWMEGYGHTEQEGYLKYGDFSAMGLSNQGWKDSWDGIVNEDGTLAAAPIALVEVQGYVYEAKLGMAALFERAGESARAKGLRRQAWALRENFNRDFWMEDKGCFALALHGSGAQAGVLSSNPGHALWSGIADIDKAQKVMERLMKEDMFSGWGIRTLSEREKRYNPLGYHLGTVWPHDNSIIAAGFKRYGFSQAALRVFGGMFRSSIHFENHGLPELFAGFPEKDYGVPVHYPVACHPQAWAAGTIPHLIETLLGLVPEGFSRRLRIVRPTLPHFVDRLEFRALRVGGACIDLGFYRTARDSTAVEILKMEGDLEVLIEPRLS